MIREKAVPTGKIMTDLLYAVYPWVKALHIAAVIAWMAGIFYLPRLFVYHVERAAGSVETEALFQTMEWKLFRFIMRPAMYAAWICGLIMVLTPGLIDWSMIWPWAKAAAVLAMTWFHIWCGLRLSDLKAGRNRLTGRQYRMMNEVPTLLLLVIVVSVVVRPF